MVNTIKELKRIYSECNKEFFANELPDCMITVQSTKKSVLGYCTTKPVWTKTDEDKPTFHEINFSAENLNRTPEDIVGTMLHEMVHLYNLIKEVKDTSNNCTYHNKRFKREAEDRGLIIEHAPVVGWSITRLAPETPERIKKFNIDTEAFAFYRKSFELTKTKKVYPTNKYKCPSCDTKITSRKELNIICGDCNQPYELIDG